MAIFIIPYQSECILHDKSGRNQLLSEKCPVCPTGGTPDTHGWTGAAVLSTLVLGSSRSVPQERRYHLVLLVRQQRVDVLHIAQCLVNSLSEVKNEKECPGLNFSIGLPILLFVLDSGTNFTFCLTNAETTLHLILGIFARRSSALVGRKKGGSN